jgi:stress-induced morphogen
MINQSFAEPSVSMPMPVEALHACLAEAFPDAEIVIDDLAGDGDHYQLVYAALKGRMGGELHALALETSTPTQGA